MLRETLFLAPPFNSDNTGDDRRYAESPAKFGWREQEKSSRVIDR
jgi:hypothetical protein